MYQYLSILYNDINIFAFVKDNEEPDHDLFDIDGNYVPRTFFIGKLHCIGSLGLFSSLQ